jgi:hypothetical protein
MTRSTRFAALVLALFTTTALRAADEPKAAPANLDPAALEQAMAEYARVTEKHEGFKHVVGRWKIEMKDFTQGDSPEVSQGQATFQLLLGGRYLQQNFRGEHRGKRFQGMGLTGFDNAQQKFVGVWIDNMSTGIMHTTGTYDEKTHVMTETGQVQMPFGPMKMKMVTRPVDDNKFTFTMYVLGPDDSEQKIAEITYTRVAEAEGASQAAKPAGK